MNRILTATLLLAAALAVLAAIPAVALGQIPPGYWVQQVTDNDYQECPPRLNDRGQIVFERRSGPGGTGELFLYDRDSDTLTQLTDDSVVDAFPDINNDGVITWTSFIGPDGQFGPTGEIMIRDPDGTVTRLTNDAVTDWGPGINSRGHLTWYKEMGMGCGGVVTDVFFYDGVTIQPITTDAVSGAVVNQTAVLNDSDRVVWTKFDFCVNPWESEVWLWESGQTVRLTSEQIRPGVKDINNAGVVAWTHQGPRGDAIQLWDNFVVTDLTDWGTAPELNERGDVNFIRWHAENRTWQEWLFRDGQFWQLSDDDFWNDSGDINEQGEVCWRSGSVSVGNVRYLRRFDLGDLNCDTQIDAFDIEGFILALFDPATYLARYPACDRKLADVNRDGAVDAFDIEPFIDILFP